MNAGGKVHKGPHGPFRICLRIVQRSFLWLWLPAFDCWLLDTPRLEPELENYVIFTFPSFSAFRKAAGGSGVHFPCVVAIFSAKKAKTPAKV
jgi:hypothetical protein